MNKNKIKREDYEINDSGDGLFVLEYMAGVRGEEGAAIIVSEIVFEYASVNRVSLSEIFELFDLEKNEVLFRIGKPVENHVVDTKEFDKKYNVVYRGKGFFVIQDKGDYYFHYQLARQGGKSGRFKISEEIFEYARTDDVTTTQIFMKYDLYHFDVVENEYSGYPPTPK